MAMSRQKRINTYGSQPSKKGKLSGGSKARLTPKQRQRITKKDRKRGIW